MESHKFATSSLPPQFSGKDFGHWKVRMRAYLQALGEEVWLSVVTGWKEPLTTTGTDDTAVTSLTPREKWTPEQKLLANYNNKALNAIFMALNASEFRRVQGCEEAKDAWNRLICTHEGDETVKESKLELLTSQFENLRMDNSETFDDFFIRLQDIINCSAAIGQAYTDTQVVRKILRALPPRFRSRKDAITESNVIKNMSIETLAGKLRTCEMEQALEEPLKNKSVAFKATSSKEPSTGPSDDEEQDVDDNYAFLSRSFQKILKYQQNRDPRKRFPDSSNAPRSRGFERFSVDGRRARVDRKDVQCYKCRDYGHFANECDKKVDRKPGDNSKANLTVTWDDSDEDDDGNLSNVVSNYVVFSASLDEHPGGIVSSSADINVSDSGVHATTSELCDMYKFSMQQVKLLEKTNTVLQDQVESLGQDICTLTGDSNMLKEEFVKEKEDFQVRIVTLEKLNNDLETRYRSLVLEHEKVKAELFAANKQLVGFGKASANLNSLLGIGKSHSDKSGLGYDTSVPLATASTSRTTFVRPTSVALPAPVQVSSVVSPPKVTHVKHVPKKNFRHKGFKCLTCGRMGHTSAFCWNNLYPAHHPSFAGNSYWNKSSTFSMQAPYMWNGYAPWGLPRTSPYGNRPQATPMPTPPPHFWDRSMDASRKMVSHMARLVEPLPSSWYLDSGCSRHMTGDKTLIDNLTLGYGGKVRFGNGKMLPVEGKGNFSEVESLNSHELLFVKGLKSNLLSISQLCDAKFKVVFEDNRCDVFDSNHILVLSGSRSSDNCFIVTTPLPHSYV